MKNKILWRLIAYFSISLLLFSIFVGLVFVWIFGRYSTQTYQQNMVKQAEAIASTASPILCNPTYSESSLNNSSHHSEQAMNGNGRMGYGKGYGSYLRSIQLVTMADVWLVEKENGLITRGLGHSNIEFSQLPDDAEQVIAEVFTGTISVSKSFSDLLEVPTLTVGAPVLSEEGSVVGAVLLHSPVEGIAQAESKGLQILIVSMAAALLLAVLAAILLSLHFTNPLKIMKKNALLLSEGNYSVRNTITQQDEIGELANTLDLLAEKLALAEQETEKVNAFRRDFISNVSHELRTPVTVMRGSLEALCDGIVTQPEKVEEYHKQLLAESIHMQRLVNDLLELSRLQNESFEIAFSPFVLNDALADATRSITQIAAQKNVTLTLNQPENPYVLQGDYGRIRQMFLAVLDNAIKFSPTGGTVSIFQKIEGTFCTVIIEDHGAGIPAEDLPNIFSRFYSIHNTQNKSGTGLGLSITNEIAKRHGIQLEVTSVPQQTQFIFIFK